MKQKRYGTWSVEESGDKQLNGKNVQLNFTKNCIGPRVCWEICSLMGLKFDIFSPKSKNIETGARTLLHRKNSRLLQCRMSVVASGFGIVCLQYKEP